jgi:hypothetical protein
MYTYPMDMNEYKIMSDFAETVSDETSSFTRLMAKSRFATLRTPYIIPNFIIPNSMTPIMHFAIWRNLYRAALAS